MNKVPLLFSILISLILGFYAVTVSLIKPSEVWAQSNNQVPGQILIKFKDNTLPNVIDKQLKINSAKVIDRVHGLDVLVLSVPEFTKQRIINALSKNPFVEYAEPNLIANALFIPNDPNFASKQWGLENTGQTIQSQVGTSDADIDGPSAWDIASGSSTIRVAILDTGIDQNHEDLSTKIVVNKNYTDSPTPDDLYGHGTHVGGIVAAVTDNGVGIAGGCPLCTLMNVKVLNDDGAGAYSWIANGITWSADNGAKVINMSLGGSSPSRTLERAINYAWNKGVVLTGAAGNSGNQSKTYPGAYNNVIAVAATDNKDQKASFSSYGSKWVDVSAPGVNIFSTFPNHSYKINKSLNYDFGSGTSMATPFASAVAALIWSTPSGTSASNVRSKLESSADRIIGTGTYWSKGRINAANAVAP